MKTTLFLLTALLCGALSAREVEVAVVRETRDPEFREARFRTWTRFFPKDARIIDADALTRPGELAQYRRLVIPAAPRNFSPAMLDGLARYVEEGGLVITESIMSGIDTDGDFKEDFSLTAPLKKRKAGHPRPKAVPPTGVTASGDAAVESVTAKMECPLSAGFPAEQAVPVSFHFRNVRRADGIVVFTAAVTLKNDRKNAAMPLVTVRNSGKGAYLFLPFQMEKLVQNALSAQTLDWLTAQE